MPCNMQRTNALVLSGLLFVVALATQAGELYHPVPPNAQVTRLTRFNLRYSLRDVIADGVQKVEFYITDDMGATWRLYGEDADRVSPMTIEVPGEGVYGFVSVATDRFGNREREPSPRSRPETVIVVDRTPPTAKWLEPLQDVLARGGAVELKYEASDDWLGTGPVKIQYAANAQTTMDRDAAWTTVQENLSATGSINWTPPGSGKYNFRLIVEDRAGNLAVAYNPATVIVDTVAPMVTGVSPLRSNQLKVDIRIDADDGPDGSGVSEISLYVTDNGAATWTLVKETTETGESVPVKRAPGQTIAFTAERPGDFGLWPVVFDRAGNASALPQMAVVGPYILVIDTEPPVVNLSNSFLSGMATILANDTRTVEWTAYDPHISPNSAAIHLSLDNGNTWQEIRSGLASSGFNSVNFPFGSQSEEARLKVTVADEFGNIGESVSESFRLSSADTVVTGVQPLGGAGTSGSAASPAPGGAGGDPYAGLYNEPGTPPYIPATPPLPGASPVSPTPSVPAPATQFPTGGSLPSASGTSYATPTPSVMDPYGDPYATSPYPTSPSIPTPSPSVPGQDESTASSLPRAMLEGSQSSSAAPSAPLGLGAGSQTSSPWSSSTGTSPAPTVTPPAEWAPTPGAGSQPAAPATPATPAWPSASGGDDFAFPPLSGSTDFASSGMGAPSTPVTPPPAATPLPPPAGIEPTAPVTPPATQTPSLGTDWSFPALGEGSSDVAPPPLSSPGTDLSMPELSGGFSMDDWGTSLAPPPLGGADTGLSAPSLPTPPAAPATPIPTPSAPVEVAQIPTPVAPPTAPGGSLRPSEPATTEPTAIPPLSGFPDDLRAPPLGSAQTQRPTDPRQLSTHYAEESRRYLDEGRVDLALESATRSLNEDDTNPMAYSALALAYVNQEPPNFARAATLAKEATNLGRDWYSWWVCADVYYRWSHARNTAVQAMNATGQQPAPDMVEERNQALSNAQIAIGNSAMLAQNNPETDRERVAMTQGEIVYLRALAIPEPPRPASDSPAAQSEYNQAFAAYRAAAAPILLESLPYFQTAVNLGGAPSYREAFRLGIVNFRLGGLERDSGNQQQATLHYETAARFLEEATVATEVPPEGPREAYYMLAYCHDQLALQPGRDRARHRELALRYWRQTANFYSSNTPQDSAYRDYAEQRIAELSAEMGR